MLGYFSPEDNENSGSEYHQKVRKLSKEPLETEDDKIFSQEEILAVLKKFDAKKAPGQDGINSEMLLRVYKYFPLSVTDIYNECRTRGCFPNQWKRSIIIPIVKPGKENSKEPSKYRPISLLNVGGKILEKLLIDRILHHVYSNNLLNKKPYGFIPQKSTLDAEMAVKEAKKCVILVSLDVQGAFDAAWWPSILNNLKDLSCPKNLYSLVQDYLKNIVASLSSKTTSAEKVLSKGCPQGSCSGPGLWNIFYNSLLNLKYSQNTEVLAFADDIIILTKGSNTKEAEMYCNQDVKIVTNWAKDNKIRFNENKSEVLLISRKRKRRDEQINIFLNTRRLELVEELKYLGIYLDR
jgi:hypothetical protein